MSVDSVRQAKKAKLFLSLHDGDDPLVMPNVWNPIGARILEVKGYSAVATASAAISASMGYEDGEKILLSTLMDITTRIATVVDIPVTADIESGYGESIQELKITAEKVLESGVVGINIEDSLEEGGVLRRVDLQCERIAAVREVATAHGIHLVINARIDSFLTDMLQSEDERMQDVLMRTKEYVVAGADCVFPVGVKEEESIKRLRSEISIPINILATESIGSLRRMKELGINRVTFGPQIFRSCLKKFETIIVDLKNGGDFFCYEQNSMSFDECQKYLVEESENAE